MGPRNIQQQWRRRWREMSTKTTKTTTEASSEDIQCVQGTGDNDGGVSKITTVPVDWQQQQSVDFLFYCITNIHTVSFLYCRCIVLILFSSDSFFLFTERNTISTAIMWEIFFYQVYTHLAYVPRTHRRVKKLRVLIINKDLRKSLARKNETV